VENRRNAVVSENFWFGGFEGGLRMARGRKSAASLAIVPLVPGQGRPEPPADLDEIEQRIWREVVDALPAHWLDPAGQLVLRRLAAQAAVSERQEGRLRQLRADGQDDSEEAAELVIAHGAVAKTVAHLLAQLRATPRSRTVPRAAGAQIGQTPTQRPWEIRSRGETEGKPQ
jgi:hypothetical protein